MPTTSRHLSPLLASFQRRRPMRAGSLIVTIYGDAIVPRGGSLWLGSLLEMMAGFGVEPGLVRTALSRLVADGWFARTRIGKQSYYRLSTARAAELEAATSRIYRSAEPAWAGEMEIAILATPDTAGRAAQRERLLRDGWGQAAANVMLRPNAGAASGTASRAAAQPAQSSDVITMLTQPQPAETARTLARTCWQLDALADAYRDVLTGFGPVAQEIADGAHLDDAQAFQLRILLIHDWRRIVLRDPLLPRAMLPADWPGTLAQTLVASLYPRLLAGAERWLDRHGVNEDGPLAAPVPALKQRFATA